MRKVLLALMIVLVACSFALEQSRKQKPFKIAAIFQTAIEEPWDGVIHQALSEGKKGKSETSSTNLQKRWLPRISRRVLREYAERKFDLIVGDAFLAGEEPSRRVAKDYPKIAFAFGSEFGPVAELFRVRQLIHEPGLSVRRDRRQDDQIQCPRSLWPPSHRRGQSLVNAFKAGALKVNPRSK